jgi:AraC-like DNA-binding protein/mannose-6-phosphate isomerase-like protein (cupin superfamily)
MIPETEKILFDLNMNELEHAFKEEYLAHPERKLEIPHSEDEIKDILTRITNPAEVFSQKLLEDQFINSDMDIAFFHHLRYLPVYWHQHDFFELVWVLHGSCTNYIVGQQLEMNEGDICIISTNTSHAIRVFSDDCYVLNILMRSSTFDQAFFGILSGNDILADFFAHILYGTKDSPYLIFPTGNDPELIQYINLMQEESMQNNRYKSRLLNAYIQTFFIKLLRNHENEVIIPSGSGYDDNLIRILHYIQDNFRNLTLKQLADHFNYSERHTQRIIKSVTNMNFSENIQKLKMQKAAELLRNTSLSTQAISDDLGFATTNNFRVMFKKHYGLKPSEYRNNQKQIIK